MLSTGMTHPLSNNTNLHKTRPPLLLQVQALHIQLLRKDATILSLRKMMEDGGDDNNVDGSKGKK